LSEEVYAQCAPPHFPYSKSVAAGSHEGHRFMDLAPLWAHPADHFKRQSCDRGRFPSISSSQITSYVMCR